MKKLLLFIALAVTSILSATNSTQKVDSIRQISGFGYSSDTLLTILKGDSVNFKTDKSKFSFNKPVKVNGKLLANVDSLTNVARLNKSQIFTKKQTIQTSNINDRTLEVIGDDANSAFMSFNGNDNGTAAEFASISQTQPTVIINNAADGKALRVDGSAKFNTPYIFINNDTVATRDSIRYMLNNIGILQLGESGGNAWYGDKGKESYLFTSGLQITAIANLDTIRNCFSYPPSSSSLYLSGNYLYGVITHGAYKQHYQIAYTSGGLFGRRQDDSFNYSSWSKLNEQDLSNYVTLNTNQTLTEGKIITSTTVPCLDLRTGTSENIALIATSNSTMPTLFIGNANDEGLAAQIAGNVDVTGIVTFNSATDTAATKMDLANYVTKNTKEIISGEKTYTTQQIYNNGIYVNTNLALFANNGSKSGAMQPYTWNSLAQWLPRVTDGFQIYGDSAGLDKGELVLETNDNGNERVLFANRMGGLAPRTDIGYIDTSGVIFSNRIGQFKTVKIGANDSAATKAELRAKTVDLSNYVTTNTSQSITGQKTFSKSLISDTIKTKNIGYSDVLTVRNTSGINVFNFDADNYKFAWGKAEGDNAYIQSNGEGSSAWGKTVSTGAYIKADAEGSSAWGKAAGENSYIVTAGDGSFAWGKTEGENSYINTNDESSTAWGKVEGYNSYIKTDGQAAMAHGKTVGDNSHIYASGEASTAWGKVEDRGSSIETFKTAGFSSGYIQDSIRSIVNNGEASWAVGDSLNINSHHSYNFGRGIATIERDSNTFNVGFSKKEFTVKKDSIKVEVPIYSKSNITTTGNIYAANIPKIAYGQIYVSDGTASQSIPNGATYTKLTLFTDTLSDGGYNVTSSATNDNFTCKVAGMYSIRTRFSGTVSNSCSIYGAIFRTRSSVASEMHNTEGEYRYGSTSDFSSTPAGGLVYLQVGDTVDFRVRHSNGSAITFTGTQLSLDIRLERAY